MEDDSQNAGTVEKFWKFQQRAVITEKKFPLPYLKGLET